MKADTFLFEGHKIKGLWGYSRGEKGVSVVTLHRRDNTVIISSRLRGRKIPTRDSDFTRTFYNFFPTTAVRYLHAISSSFLKFERENIIRFVVILKTSQRVF